jgi:hypothetical protein
MMGAGCGTHGKSARDLHHAKATLVPKGTAASPIIHDASPSYHLEFTPLRLVGLRVILPFCKDYFPPFLR